MQNDGKQLLKAAILSASGIFTAEERAAVADTANDMCGLDPTYARVYEACRDGDAEKFALLLQSGAPSYGTRDRDLIEDVQMDRVMAEIFLKESPPIAADRLQTMLAQYLSYYYDHEVAQLLFERGVRPSRGTIVAALLTSWGCPEKNLELFAKWGVDMNAVDDYGFSILHKILVDATVSACRKGCCDEMDPLDRRYLADKTIPAMLAAGVRIEGKVQEGMWAELQRRVEKERPDDDECYDGADGYDND